MVQPHPEAHFALSDTLGTQGTMAGVTDKQINWEILSLKHLSSLLPVLISDVPVNSSNFFRDKVPSLSPGPMDTDPETEKQHPHDLVSDASPRAMLTVQGAPAGTSVGSDLASLLSGRPWDRLKTCRGSV